MALHVCQNERKSFPGMGMASRKERGREGMMKDEMERKRK